MNIFDLTFSPATREKLIARLPGLGLLTTDDGFFDCKSGTIISDRAFIEIILTMAVEIGGENAVLQIFKSVCEADKSDGKIVHADFQKRTDPPPEAA